jgi:hypothetical protein
VAVATSAAWLRCERTLRKAKKTSLFKERNRATVEAKKQYDFIYVNAHLELTQIARVRQGEH